MLSRACGGAAGDVNFLHAILVYTGGDGGGVGLMGASVRACK